MVIRTVNLVINFSTTCVLRRPIHTVLPAFRSRPLQCCTLWFHVLVWPTDPSTLVELLHSEWRNLHFSAFFPIFLISTSVPSCTNSTANDDRVRFTSLVLLIFLTHFLQSCVDYYEWIWIRSIATVYAVSNTLSSAQSPIPTTTTISISASYLIH